MAKWNVARGGPEWLMDSEGRVYGYKDKRGREFGIPQVQGSVGDAEGNGPTDTSLNILSGVSGAGNRLPVATYGRRLAVFGDSRMSGGYSVYGPSAVSVTGSVVSVTATNIGLAVAVGHTITLGRNTDCDYMRATVATVADNDNITANINFPAAGLPSGAIRNGNSTVTLRNPRRPINGGSYMTHLLALLGQPFDVVDCYAYSGCRIAGVIEGQLEDAFAVGFDAAVVHVGANDYIASLDNRDASYVIAGLQTIVRRLAGRPVWLFLEPPLSGSYYSATNLARIQAINAWARSAGATVVDLYAAMDDGTGVAKTGWLSDGLHPGQLGALNAMLAVYSTLGIGSVARAASTQNQGTARFPVANPTMAGTLGAAQTPTGYSKTAVSLTTETAFGLQAKSDGTGNEWYIDLATTGAGQHHIRCAGTAVTSGARYRVRLKMQLVSMVGLDYIEVTLRNNSGDAFLSNILTGSSSGLTGDSDGTYTLWIEQDVAIPAGVTSVYVRPRLFFDAAGGGRVVYSDLYLEAVG